MAGRKQKAGWVRTNTSWETRKVVWYRYSLGDTDTAIIRYLELNQGKYEDIPTHRDTIGEIRNELLYMPIDVIQQLITELPEIHSFIGELRPELKDKLLLPSGRSATLHDKEKFNKTDSIINEEVIQSFLDTLDFQKTYPGSTLGKLMEFKEFFLLERNKYVNAELTGLCDSLVQSIIKINRFLSSFFRPIDDVGTRDSQDDTMFKFNPQNRYSREYEEYLADLLELTNSVREAYSAYRGAVRRLLFL